MWTEVSGRISLEDWKEHFMTEFEGTSHRQTNAGKWTEVEEEEFNTLTQGEEKTEKVIIMNSQMRK